MRADHPLELSRLGILDIGSNSIRFVIYELSGASFTPIYNEKVLAGLGRDLKTTGALHPRGKAIALASIIRFATLAKAQSLKKVLIGATAALREASDAPEFITAVKQETGMAITPVSGSEEARLTGLGVITSDFRADGIAADLGGASLEVIPVSNDTPGEGISYPLGPFPIVGQDLSASAPFDKRDIRKKINKQFKKQPLPYASGQTLYLIGGAWRNLAGVHQRRTKYPLRTLQAYELTPEKAAKLAKWAYGSGREPLLTWPGISTTRAETLPYSGLLLDVLLKRLKPSRIVISTTGLREGLVYDSMPKEVRERDALFDSCRDLAHGNLQGLNFGAPLFQFLQPVAKKFPLSFEPKNENRLRRAACHLTGIGKGLHPDYRAALVFEDVLYAPFPDLTHKERAYLAQILFSTFSSGSKTPNEAAMALLLEPEEKLAAQIYGTAIRVAVVATGRTASLLKEFHLDFEGDVLVLDVRHEYAELLSERVAYRLTKLGQVSGFETRVQS